MRRCLFERLRQDRTQREVARSARLNASIYSNIERGRMNPRPDELRQIADALGWSGDPDRLLDHITGASLPEFRDSQREAQAVAIAVSAVDPKAVSQ